MTAELRRQQDRQAKIILCTHAHKRIKARISVQEAGKPESVVERGVQEERQGLQRRAQQR